MKTSELKRILSEDLVETFSENEDVIFGVYWTVKKREQRLLVFGVIPLNVLKALGEYVNTPIEEREEEKKYEITFEEQALVKKDSGNFCFLWDFDSTVYQRTFTQSEIDDLPRLIKGAIECGFLKKVEIE